MLYDQLHALTPTPVVALNRAVALAEVRGPAAGLAAVDDLRSSGLHSYYLFHASRADLLRRLGRSTEAAAAYATARSLTTNPVEQAFLDTQRRHHPPAGSGMMLVWPRSPQGSVLRSPVTGCRGFWPTSVMASGWRPSRCSLRSSPARPRR